MGVDDFLLPLLEHDRPLVFLARAVLGKQTLPVDGVAPDVRAAHQLPKRHRRGRQDGGNGGLYLVPYSGPRVGAGDREAACALAADDVAVAQVLAQEVRVALCVERGVGAAWAGGANDSGGGGAAAVATTPMTDRRPRQAHVSGHIGRGQSGRVQATGLVDTVLWMHGGMVATTTHNFGDKCPRWDSNPHWMDFEAMDSADWSTGAWSVRSSKGPGHTVRRA